MIKNELDKLFKQGYCEEALTAFERKVNSQCLFFDCESTKRSKENTKIVKTDGLSQNALNISRFEYTKLKYKQLKRGHLRDLKRFSSMNFSINTT